VCLLAQTAKRIRGLSSWYCTLFSTIQNFVVGIRRRLNCALPVTIETANLAFDRQHFRAAVKQYRVLAANNNPHAQWRLGQCYESGAGTIRNPAAAVRAYLLAAEAGVRAAQSRLGEIYLLGLAASEVATEGALKQLKTAADTRPTLIKQLYAHGLEVDADPRLAAHWNRRAATAGDTGAAARLGHQLATGLGCERDLSQAEEWLNRSVEGQDPLGYLGLGLLYAGSYGALRVPKDPIPWLEKAAFNGNATARLTLALLLLDTTHDEQTNRRSVRLLHAAAKDGEVYAMYQLGELYRRGDRIPPSAGQAETWLRRAAAKGSIKALVSLVHLLSNLPTPDRDAAAILCREAADLGDPEAQYLCGCFCLDGIGVPRNQAAAASWFHKAAAQGVVAAYERLGALYADGAGVTQDSKTADTWFTKAIAAGDKDALKQRSRLRATPSL
jgi:hypothetical protein